MLEHLTAQQVEQLIRRQLAAKDLLRATRHLADCAACRGRVSEAHRAPERLATLRADLHPAAPLTHLSYEQLAGYADGSIGEVDREVAENHLGVCTRCAADAGELIALRDRLGAPAETWPLPPPLPTAWERLAAFWHRSLRWGPVLTTGTVMAFLIVAAVLGRVWWRAAWSARPEAAKSPLPAVSSSPPVDTVSTVPEAAVASSPSPSVVVALSDNGRRVTLDEGGKLGGLPRLTPGDERMVQAALARQQVPRSPALAGLASQRSRLMGGRGEGLAFALLGPLGTVVATERPTFRWQPLAGAERYTVSVLDEDFNLVATSGPLKKTSWVVASPLRRGANYRWQVTAETASGEHFTSPSTPAPEARFGVLGQGEADELRRAARPYHASHLLMGLRYARAGLLDEAEREFRALVRDDPDSPVARRLLREVRGRRR